MPSEVQELDLTAVIDFEAILPCDGILYGSNFGDAEWNEPCDNPAEWTRSGHCTADTNYCLECKELISDWARHGWVRCASCNKITWPEHLNWRKL